MDKFKDFKENLPDWVNEENFELYKMRHTAEHVLHLAVTELFPEVKRAMGPPIEDGFYFDFDPGSIKITEEDLEKIERKMQEIVKQNLPIIREEISIADAKILFEGNEYKLEWISEFEKDSETVTVYWTGEPNKEGSDVDLCKGPHVESTKNIGHFKLLSIAGAYWRGDEKNKMLTRIYATTFKNKKDLEDFLEKRKLAEERNHRKIGKEMDLYAIFPEIGQGLPVWLPNGYAMRRVLEDYMLDLERKHGYVHMLTPHINKAELFEKSGHLGFYKESMYAPMQIDDETFYLKPMNCPAGMMVYNMDLRSYRDLPMKMGELGTVYRYEKSGELHGLQRVRGFTQNDAHIFCTQGQLESQFMEVMDMMNTFYKDIGFKDYYFRLSLSDPKNKEKYCGDPEAWKKVEDIMRKVLEKNHIEFKEASGEAAFYGPKIDVQAINVFGKEDSISTNQVDFNLPERFDLTYVDENGEKKRPFVIHRALIGSFERFFAFLIEYYGGAFPLWFAPEQIRILPISDKNVEYANKVDSILKKEGRKMNLWIRSSVDERSETLQSKVRDSEIAKVPYTLIVGGREEEKDQVSVRARGKGDLGAVSLNNFKEKLLEEINSKALNLWE
ncbi:threonine--tRNA ligase [Candidatus Dojkabacteria bacterium]|nr:threonine--tRNA ligase [Candidatus Dojkabacteria bacterium]